MRANFLTFDRSVKIVLCSLFQCHAFLIDFAQLVIILAVFVMTFDPDLRVPHSSIVMTRFVAMLFSLCVY